MKCTWICGVAFLHDYFIDDGLVIFVKDFPDVFNFLTNPILQPLELLIDKVLILSHRHLSEFILDLRLEKNR
jgi:hypothetical protein